jgi:molybdenum cofactor cytidylyltransferase
MVTAVILAAGASTRMGTNKLLLPLGGEALARRTVRQVCAADFSDVLVIVGHEADLVRSALEGLGCRFAVNASYQGGLGTSFRAAVEHLDASDAAMFALADQPFIEPSLYKRLVDAYREHRPDIVSVRYGSVTAPPHLFVRALFPELAVLEQGARPVLARHADRCHVLNLPAASLFDIDTPEDYARAQQLAERLRTADL